MYVCLRMGRGKLTCELGIQKKGLDFNLISCKHFGQIIGKNRSMSRSRVSGSWLEASTAVHLGYNVGSHQLLFNKKHVVQP